MTLDVARRIALLFSNALSFANSFMSQNVEDISDAQLPTKGLTERDRESLFRQHVYHYNVLPLCEICILVLQAISKLGVS